MPRLLLVSNRLPLTVRSSKGAVEIVPSTGGLATGLAGPHQQSGGLWMGWPGDLSGLDDAGRREAERELASLRTVPVNLTKEEVAGFYEGFSNRVLWPLFHYLLDYIPLQAMEWELYRKVNLRYAEEVARHYRPGDLIWVHDYQLCLVPGFLRERLPDARIGFFLHIPFPSSEVIQALPWRNALLEGMLGADLIGFHTYPYLRHFSNALLRLLGVAVDVDRVSYRGRQVRLAAHPMGIDAARFAAEAALPETAREVDELRSTLAGQRILLGVDRLDYTKGIRRRMLALDRLLEREPSLKGKVTLVQIAVPSRCSVNEYTEFRQDVDEVVGRVNGAHGTAAWAPVRYFYRGFTQRQLVAFYRAADVMLVTPLRDGMNLVAKEFIASRTDERGVLLLSELAGASAELGEAVLVNPYDVDGMGEAIRRALAMPEREQQIRMRALRHRVTQADVHHWARAFIHALEHVSEPRRDRPAPLTSADALAALQGKIRGAHRRVLLLDCDGTLLQLGTVPSLIGPDAELRALLLKLTQLPRTTVSLVSGRPPSTLEDWFGDLPLGLYAEHGLWSRSGPGQQWLQRSGVSTTWKERVRPILENHARRTPGAFVEEKSAALGWHYRMADPEFSQLQAHELLILLREALSNLPVEILSGDKVIEVRPHGVNKGLIVAPTVERAGGDALVVAMGDDQTDEELFAALPPGSIAVHVGPRPSRAPYRVVDPAAARRFLRGLLE